MERIELNPLDKKDLLELLEYAKKQKELNRPEKTDRHYWDDTNWWLLRIEQLEMIINGESVSGSYIQSSFQTMNTEMSQEEKQRWRYRNGLENEIFDVFDS